MNDELRILLVEDFAADAELITRELRKANMQFSSHCVETRDDFLGALASFKPHLIISDFSLGQFNALEALKLLRDRAIDLPFVLVTGSQSEEVAVACIKEGADDYILKASLKRLPSAVVGALRKKEAEGQRTQALIALQQSEELFRSLIENSSDIIKILAPDGTIIYVSPSVERVLGYKPEELLGKKASEFIHHQNVAFSMTTFVADLGTYAPGRSLEYRFRHKDGSWRVLEALGNKLVGGVEVKGILINSRDVTERKRAEDRIHEQAALLDKAQDAIFVLDLDGRISFWNHGAQQLYGWSGDEAIGNRMEDLLAKRDEHVLMETRKIVLETGEWSGELNQVTKVDHEIIVESRWTLVKDPEGNPKSVLVINTDVTERKRLEAQFLRVQRMESIGTLAGGIAHDLNNVLTPILMAIRMLRDETGSDAGQEILNTLETSALRGSSIVQQILSFARGVEGERSALQVRHPLAEVINIAKDTFPKAIQIVSRIDKELWPIIGDATQLHQVFMNLCVNARDAMPHGGRLTVEAENLTLDENYARMQPDAKAGRYVVVTVSDTGMGIPPALMGKIFEPFFTTKEHGKGTGLGLSTLMGIVRGHGGFVTVYSEVGKGTRFKVHIPAADVLEKLPEDETKLDLPAGQGELILVADDESAIREIIKVTLEANGYRVVTADDGTEALARFVECKDEVRAVVVDIMMPFMDGPATMRALRKMNPEINLIAVSGLMEKDKMTEFSDKRNIAFLAKPFTTEQLLITLRRLLDSPVLSA